MYLALLHCIAKVFHDWHIRSRLYSMAREALRRCLRPAWLAVFSAYARLALSEYVGLRLGE